MDVINVLSESVTYRPMEQADVDRIIAASDLQKFSGARKTFETLFSEQEQGKRKVIIADCGNELAGYVSLLPTAKGGAFKNKGIPQISGLMVFEKFREHGIGTELMNRIEKEAETVSDEVCLAVGLYPEAGQAQRMFVKRGYVPDGTGAWYGRSNAKFDLTVILNDSLALYMSKHLSQSPSGIVIGDLSIDALQPEKLCDFYATLTGWKKSTAWDCPALTVENGLMILFMDVDCGYVPPVWPEEPGKQQKQMHFNFQVDDLPAAIEKVIVLGGVKAAEQFGGEQYVTMLDPEGHPFCLCRK
jgi:predicted enzyme related to lactoylglutathione lyase/GNAT superfamily N-acetyltransferase